ncbi:transporter [Streptococcus oricebi]|uniref:Transporter n=1 Tax=Streptococcus oricebi TaxID=1547447 RepID=A0ABS5B508_9STRE|nr:transporter [Streptococcus oricebi]MBP2623905.1 transporter [Streptococcus oricebi]
MKLAFRNRLYGFLTLSRLLNSMGSSLYNIIFVIYAANMFQSKLLIGIANITMVVPTVFTVWVGMRADKSKQKSKWLIATGFIQALLFAAMAFFINQASLLVFSTVCLLNIISDVLSDFANGLRLPIIQKNIAQADLMEAYSFSQFLTYICNLAGQALGVWLLTISANNFAMVALINALSFLLSSLVLLFIKKDLTYEKVVHEKEEKQTLRARFSLMFDNIRNIFHQSGTPNFIQLLLAILFLNALGGSIAAVYNIFLIDQALLGLTYSQSLLLVEVILVGGILLGSLTPHDYFSKKSLSSLVRMNALIFSLVGLFNLLSFPPLLGIFILAFASYLTGKVNPKINSMLLANLPSHVLAQTSNFLSLLFTLSLPVGTAFFSLVASWNMSVTWLIFFLLATLSLLLTSQSKD